MTNDLKTTIGGGGLAILILSQVDVAKLAQGDMHQVLLIVMALLVAVTFYFVNKVDPPKGV